MDGLDPFLSPPLPSSSSHFVISSPHLLFEFILSQASTTMVIATTNMSFSANATFVPKSLFTTSSSPIRTQIQSHKLNSSSRSLQISKVSSLGFTQTIPRTSTFKVFAKVSKGSVPPGFNLRDQDGKMVNLSRFKGKLVVLYFYPADETPGCTKEACAFRDSYEKFKKAGAEVMGISGDSPDSHKAFAKKNRLPFTLLSDDGNKVRKEWGVPGDFFGSLPGRETYVIDRKGVVQLVYNNQFQPEKHIQETLKVLESL